MTSCERAPGGAGDEADAAGVVLAGGVEGGAARARRGGDHEDGNRPGGSAAQWRPWCLLQGGAPPAGEAGWGKKKARSFLGAGRECALNARLPGRSHGADEIERAR